MVGSGAVRSRKRFHAQKGLQRIAFSALGMEARHVRGGVCQVAASVWHTVERISYLSRVGMICAVTKRAASGLQVQGRRMGLQTHRVTAGEQTARARLGTRWATVMVVSVGLDRRGQMRWNLVQIPKLTIDWLWFIENANSLDCPMW